MTNYPPLSGSFGSAYTFGFPSTIIVFRPPENLERDNLVFVPTLPNFNHLGDALGILSLPHNAFEFV